MHTLRIVFGLTTTCAWKYCTSFFKFVQTVQMMQMPRSLVAGLVEQQPQRRCGSGTVVPSPPRRVHQAGWLMYAEAAASQIVVSRAKSGQLSPASVTKSSPHLLRGLPTHLCRTVLNQGFHDRMRRIQRPSSDLAALPASVHFRCLLRDTQSTWPCLVASSSLRCVALWR